MVEDYSNQTLGVMIKDLKERTEEQYQYLAKVMNDGNKGICRRLDTQNGNVADNKSYIIQHRGEYNVLCENVKTLLADREDKFKKYSDLFWKVLLIVILGGLGANQLIDKLL